MADDPAPLEAEIRRRIAAAGPMPVGEYMTLCLTDAEHGYYTTRDPFGAGGDFITAPEVSQMFGETDRPVDGRGLATDGLAARACDVVELGPGRGTMMSDALRAAKVVPAFLEAAAIHLVEISPALAAQQERSLRHLSIPLNWHRALADVPNGPTIIVANEFFDALPVNQAVKTEQGWHERLVEIDSAGKLAFTVAPEALAHFDRLLPPALRDAHAGSIFEWRSDTVAMELGRRLARDGGAALVIDYGHAESAAGDTLQAVGAARLCRPAQRARQRRSHRACGFRRRWRGRWKPWVPSCYGPITQSQFLRRLGILTRAAALKSKAGGSAAATIDGALKRLISEGEAGMGALFKAAAFAHPSLGVPPGFED